MSLMAKLERMNEKGVNLQNRRGAKLPVCILVDTSHSMNYDEKIVRLNEGLSIYRQQLLEDGTTRDHIEIAIVEFGKNDVHLAMDFDYLVDQSFPVFTAGGVTPLCSAVQVGLDALEEQLDVYAEQGIISHPPHLIIMTDGEPTSETQYEKQADGTYTGVELKASEPEFIEALERFKQFKDTHGLVSISIGIGNDIKNAYFLEQFATTPTNVLRMNDQRNIVELFKLLSRTTSILTRGVPNPERKLDLISQDNLGIVEPWKNNQ